MLNLKQYKPKYINNIQVNNDGNLFQKLNLLEHTKALYKLNFNVVLFTEKNQPLSWHKSLAKNQELQLAEVLSLLLTVV